MFAGNSVHPSHPNIFFVMGLYCVSAKKLLVLSYIMPLLYACSMNSEPYRRIETGQLFLS